MERVWSFSGGSEGTEFACNAGDPSWIPESGRSPGGEGMATHSSILAWEIPWTEELGGATILSVAKSRTGLSTGHGLFTCKQS